MKSLKLRFVEFTSYFFILLFCYAAISKMTEFELFQVQIAQSPLLSSFSGIISYGVLVAELAICMFLIFEKTRLTGLYASFFLMTSFTVYIYMILNYSEFIPCSCGGILEKMDWTTHLIFNVATVILAALGVYLCYVKKSYSLMKRTSLLLLLFVVSVTSLIILYRQSEFMIKKENNFTRRFLQHPLERENTMKLKEDTYYFAGVTDDSIYFGNYNTPFSVISLDKRLTKVKKTAIAPDKFDFSFKRTQIKIDSTNFYFFDGTVPVVYEGTLGRKNLNTISYGQAYFNQIVSLGKRDFALSTYSTAEKKQILGTLSPTKENHLILKPNLLESKTDGIFESDGQIHYDRYTKTAIYMYYYKNPILIMDRNLQLKSVFKTIDTISTPNIEVANLSDGQKKMNKPPLKVNNKAVFYQGLLFIESDLIGKFEDSERWKDSFIIDVYSIGKEQYIGSFYIPNPTKSKSFQMDIDHESLYVIIENEITKYRLAQNIRKHFISGEAENLKKE